jgi:hypothetical protein
MTDRDKELIRQAGLARNYDWDIPMKLAEQADTAEAKKELLDMARRLHCLDEAISDHADEDRP